MDGFVLHTPFYHTSFNQHTHPGVNRLARGFFHRTRILTIVDERLGLPDNKAMKLLTSTSAPLQP